MATTKNKKGTITLYFVFFISAITIILFATILVPMGVQVNAEFYKQGEKMMLNANDTISGIQDPTMRAKIQNNIQTALDASANNIEVNSALFQYSWILVLGMSAIIVFLYTRRIVEYGQGGGGGGYV